MVPPPHLQSSPPRDWAHLIEGALHLPSSEQLRRWLDEERDTHEVFPPAHKVYEALYLTPPDQVKVVILGQDPYHGPGQAHGLSFSVQAGVKVPPSLKNIFRELQDDLKLPSPPHGDLSGWARQGVLLLNTVLTVRAHQANAHRKRGWEPITDAIIERLSETQEHVVFVLWGKPAQKKHALISPSKHTIIQSVHPSPLSAYRGFFGSRPFSKINRALGAHGQREIRWGDLSSEPQAEYPIN
jgi:uracil-DNA glycosylase